MCKHAVSIQSTWRSFSKRKKVKMFSKLPSDIWYTILELLKQTPEIYFRINRVISSRITLLYWTHPFHKMRTKLHTLYLIRKYSNILETNVIVKAFHFTFRLLKFANARFTTSSLLINSTLECLDEKINQM